MLLDSGVAKAKRKSVKGMTFLRLSPSDTGLFSFLERSLNISNQQLIVDAVNYLESLVEKNEPVVFYPVVAHMITANGQSIIAPVRVTFFDGKIKDAYFITKSEVSFELPPSEKNLQRLYIGLIKKYNSTVTNESEKIVKYFFKKYDYVSEKETYVLKGFLFDPPFVEKLTQLSKKLKVTKSNLIKFSILLYHEKKMSFSENKAG